jgi:hypothetical protein
VTRLFDVPINDDPPKDWTVPINAPVLRTPLTPRSVRYGMTGDFDQSKAPSVDALDKAQPGDLHELADAGATPLGDAASEAQLRYEIKARLDAAKRRGELSGSAEDDRAAVTRILKENPNATDHSTILTNPEHAEKVLAYDVAVGWVNGSRITAEDMWQFRVFAHWMFLARADLDVDGFKQYWKSGLFRNHQVKFTYNLDHMANQASGIVDARVRSLTGYFK